MAMMDKFLIPLVILFVFLQELYGHGMVLDPVNRSSAGKAKFNVTINWNDNGNNCGGIGVQYNKNGGKCGECGDDYSLVRPRPNENGGTYGVGAIVARYKSGVNIVARVYISTNHFGKFFFSICSLDNSAALETEECFEKYPLRLVDGSDHYTLKPGLDGDILISLKLPKDLVCKHCVFRWHWIAGNNWGSCRNGTEGLGCGDQEQFRTCSDISIV